MELNISAKDESGNTIKVKFNKLLASPSRCIYCGEPVFRGVTEDGEAISVSLDGKDGYKIHSCKK